MDNFTISEQYGEYSTLRGEDGKPVVLGRGGFGITVCALKLRKLGDVEIRDEFALKILRYNAMEDSKVRSRILKEILALRDLQHPNLASYKDCGEEAGCVFLVMELCKGGDLAALTARVGALPERFALQAILQVCAGLDEAHRKGYLHRDLKPTNILISEELPADAGLPWLEDKLAGGHLRFKVVDFGLAGRLESEVRGGGFMGSPMFASPEQVREQRLDSRSDIYSLGMTLWYLATGKGPLLNANGLPVADAREAMRCHTSPSQHDLAFPDHFSQGFRSLLGRMVRKAPDERFRSAQELAEAIRRQIEAMPAPLTGIEAQRTNAGPTKAPLASVATWGTGTFAEYYHVLKQVGRRSIGTFYQARHKASGNTVGFTAWVAANSPNAASEKLIGQHLDRLKSVTNDPLAPKVLTRIVDWLRTSAEWCVAEGWIEGEKLDRFVSLRGRSIPLADAMRLLWPVAQACDFLHDRGVDSALLIADEIRLQSPRAESDGPSWIEHPIDEWGDWTIRLSALSIPQELAGESSIADVLASSSTSRFDGCDAGQLRLNKSFCRLLYRLTEGADAAVAADWDAQAFTAAGKLSAQSNALLRDYICGAYADDPAVDILKRICSYEGIASIPGGPDMIAAPSVAPTRAMSSGGTGTDAGSGAVGSAVLPSPSLSSPPSSASSKPSAGSTVQPSGSVSHTARSSVSGSRFSRKSEPILDAAPANQVEVAHLVPGRPGWVRSPYGTRREQQVPGPEWLENAHIQCEATGRPFQLPAGLPPLEAILIPERFDAVLTPYVDPPGEVAVPLGQWKPNAELTCSITGRPLRQPHPLPAAIATAIDDRPGIVRSPYGDHSKIEISPELWKPGQLLACPASDQMFALPAVLPPLLAIPGEAAGSFTSPYAPDRPFDLPAPKCVFGSQFACPWTGERLALPASLPEHWKFEGMARQSEVPEAKSPYFELEGEGWQPLDAADWRPGAIIRCRGTGRPFVLPATLPVLRVKAGPNPFSVCSPFPPHEPIRIPAEDWIAGADVPVSLNAGTTCTVTLPAELPTLDSVEIAELDSVPQGRQPQARGPRGAIRSPFVEGGEWIEIPAQRWLPGARVVCPATSRPFWLPKELPLLEARLGSDLGTVHSPYTDQVVKIPTAEWIEGNLHSCPETGAKFILPKNLPLLEGGVDESRPGWVESPFDLGSAYLIDFAEWKPGGVLECPTSGRKFALPQSLPEWIPQAELDETNVGTVRNPHGPGNWFTVPATEWKAGAVVHCPETQAKITLPADLPALEATLVEGKPGYVQTPYTSEPAQMKVHPSQWRGGNLVECAATKRPLRLPENLPPLSPALPPTRKLLIPAAVLVILTVVGILVAAMIHNSNLEKLRTLPWAKTAFTWVIPPPDTPPPPVVTVTPPVVPNPETVQWPDTVVIEKGFSPKEAGVFLRLPDGSPVGTGPLTVIAPIGALERTISLREALNKLAGIPASEDLRLSFEASGYKSESIIIPRGKFYTYDQRISLERRTGTFSWPAKDPFYSTFYQTIRFTAQDADKRETEAAFGEGSVKLPMGNYSVSLIGKTDITRRFQKTKSVNIRVEDRTIFPTERAAPGEAAFEIQDGKSTVIKLPPSLPRNLAGSGKYTLTVPTVIYDKQDAEVGYRHTYDFQYWTPCILTFSEDFTGGEFIDENCLLSFGANQFLDALVTLAAMEDAKPKGAKGPALKNTEGYRKGVPLLKQLSEAQKPVEKLAALTPASIQDRRSKIFKLEKEVWELTNRILKRTPTEPDGTGDYPRCHEWFSQLEGSFGTAGTAGVLSTIVGERATPELLKTANALTTPVTVKNGPLDGYLVRQPFVVTKVDKDGQVSLQLEALITNIVEPSNKPKLWTTVLSPKKEDGKVTYYMGGVFEGLSPDVVRIINLAPVER